MCEEIHPSQISQRERNWAEALVLEESLKTKFENLNNFHLLPIYFENLCIFFGLDDDDLERRNFFHFYLV